jgi:DNA-binding response OmpR family regulator
LQVLLVEDDKSLSMAVVYLLKKEGFEVTACMDGTSGLEALEAGHFDLILLDRMLPGMDGVSILHKLRAKNDPTPVLMLTAMDGICDRVTGLDAGADDYLVKPFAMAELNARVRALLRRPQQWNPQYMLNVGDVVFDTERSTLTCESVSVTLSRTESKLMGILMRNPNQILPRDVLLDRVWGCNIVEDGNLDIYICFLRKHLDLVKSRLKIKTARGIGYQLVSDL